MEFIIIDDSIFDLFTQEKLLLKSGVATSIRTYSNPLDALAYLKEQTRVMAETIILLDLQMPGLNGFEFADQFSLLPQEVINRIRLYMISSTVDVHDIARAQANPYIIQLLDKPLNIPYFKELLKR